MSTDRSTDTAAQAPLLLLTLDEAARRLDISRETLYKHIRAGRLRTVHLSPRMHRVRPADLDAFLDALATRAGEVER